MTTDTALEFGREALTLVLTVALPLLVPALVIGVVVGILQTVTQVHEQTLTFVPRLVVVLLAAMLCLPWMLETLSEYMARIITTAGGF